MEKMKSVKCHLFAPPDSLCTLVRTLRLLSMNCLSGLFVSWFLVGFGQGDTLADQMWNKYLFPGITPCGSLSPAAPLNQRDPRPFPHTSSDGRKHCPFLPFRSWGSHMPHLYLCCPSFYTVSTSCPALYK